MTLIPGVASACAPDVCGTGGTRDMQVLVLRRHWRSGRPEDAREQRGCVSLCEGGRGTESVVLMGNGGWPVAGVFFGFHGSEMLFS